MILVMIKLHRGLLWKMTGEGRGKKNLILTFPFVEKNRGLFPTPHAATGLCLVFIKQFEVNKAQNCIHRRWGGAQAFRGCLFIQLELSFGHLMNA